MTELQKIERAKMYIDKLANGINPIDDTLASETDVINQVRVSRCLFYVSDILRQVIDNDGFVGKANSRKKKDFFISNDRRDDFSFSDKPISVSEIAARLNDLADLDECKKISYAPIAAWLIEIGALEIIEREDNKAVKRPTPQGRELGISEEIRHGKEKEYTVVVYDRQAQKFILDNVDAIVTSADVKKTQNHGQEWNATHDECLMDLYSKNVPISEIAITLLRSEESIRERLRKKGFVNDGNVGK